MGRKLWDESTDGIGATSGVSPWGIIPYSRGVNSIPQPYAYAFGILATQPS